MVSLIYKALIGIAAIMDYLFPLKPNIPPGVLRVAKVRSMNHAKQIIKEGIADLAIAEIPLIDDLLCEIFCLPEVAQRMSYSRLGWQKPKELRNHLMMFSILKGAEEVQSELRLVMVGNMTWEDHTHLPV